MINKKQWILSLNKETYERLTTLKYMLAMFKGQPVFYNEILNTILDMVSWEDIKQFLKNKEVK